MNTYHVAIIYSASKTVTVEADSPEEAMQAGYDQGHALLCHHCAHQIELGDAIGAEVSDEYGAIVLKDMP